MPYGLLEQLVGVLVQAMYNRLEAFWLKIMAPCCASVHSYCGDNVTLLDYSFY